MSQKPEDLLVTLANGTQVPWSVFRTWSKQKQSGGVTKNRKARKVTEEHKAILRSHYLGTKRSPEIGAKISATKIGNQNRCKPIMTPAGVFPSANAAIEWAIANGVVNARKKIPIWLVTQPDQYYYLPKNT
jgi:hypothetical protein